MINSADTDEFKLMDLSKYNKNKRIFMLVMEAAKWLRLIIFGS